MGWFWPVVTGRTFLDVWSVAHLAFWVFAASTMSALKWSFRRAMIVTLAVAYAWEIFERFAEHRWPQIWAHPESFCNAWMSDPLMGFVGLIIGFWLVQKQ